VWSQFGDPLPRVLGSNTRIEIINKKKVAEANEVASQREGSCEGIERSAVRGAAATLEKKQAAD
jgi:hypothetical protein